MVRLSLGCLLLAAGCGGSADVTGEKAGAGTTPGDLTPPVHPPIGDPTTDPDPDSDPTVSVERRHDCSGLDPADAGPLGGWVALTFDDGPHPTHTPAILDVLRTQDVPATFFTLGVQLADPATWDVAEEIVADPLFELANHSWDHADLALLSVADVEAQIDDTNALIETFGPSPLFFRFPYGDSTCTTHDLVTDRAMRVAGWHIDTADWCYAAIGATGTCTPDDYWRVPEGYASDMRGFTLEQVARFDGGIVLFHDIHAYTAAELEDMIIELTAAGFTFTSLDDATAFPNLVAGTPADLPYLGEPCDLTEDLCWQVEYSSWCEPVTPDDASDTRGVCTLPCEGTCLDRDGAAITFCADIGGAGQCVGRSEARNDWCAGVPGSLDSAFDRFVGGSGAGAAVVDVCAPPHW